MMKTTGPAVAAEEIGPVDAVLLSHDQHGDYRDRSGRVLRAAFADDERLRVIAAGERIAL